MRAKDGESLTACILVAYILDENSHALENPQETFGSRLERLTARL